jgi:hypothetical protein
MPGLRWPQAILLFNARENRKTFSHFKENDSGLLRQLLPLLIFPGIPQTEKHDAYRGIGYSIEVII